MVALSRATDREEISSSYSHTHDGDFRALRDEAS
jgi:hypothetical protein